MSTVFVKVFSFKNLKKIRMKCLLKSIPSFRYNPHQLIKFSDTKIRYRPKDEMGFQ